MSKPAEPAILYSFRRCPYAMRARMALDQSGQVCRLREVDFKNKPVHMVEISPKATVPVLVLDSGEVVDESLDIMLWTLGRHDSESWLSPGNGSLDDMLELIEEADGPFKTHLDRFKYHTHYDGVNRNEERDQAVKFLSGLDARIARNGQLFGPEPALADIAIFPFVRQFANVERSWFDDLEMTGLHGWLASHLASNRFQRIMCKWPVWQNGDDDIIAFAA